MTLKPGVVIARKLRKQSTPQEVKMWARLRSRQFQKYKFRRQVPIGPYIVDFYCAEKKIIIEIDGGHHMVQEKLDWQRVEYLQSQGFKVLRFWNSEVEQNLDGVFERILQVLQSPSIRQRASQGASDGLHPPAAPARGEDE